MAFLLIYLFISFLVALWAASDARGRGYAADGIIGWFMGVLFLPFVFFPLYLILRSRRSSSPQKSDVRTCPHCGRAVKGNPVFCPYCEEKLR